MTNTTSKPLLLNPRRKRASLIKKIGQSFLALYPGLVAGIILGFERTYIRLLFTLIQRCYDPLEDFIGQIENSPLKFLFWTTLFLILLGVSMAMLPLCSAISLLYGLYGMAYGAFVGFKYDAFHYENLVDLLNLFRWKNNDDFLEEYKTFREYYAREYRMSFDTEDDDDTEVGHLDVPEELVLDLCHSSNRCTQQMGYAYINYQQEWLFSDGASHTVKWRKIDHVEQFRYARRHKEGKFLDLNAMNYYKSLGYDWTKHLTNDSISYLTHWDINNFLLECNLLISFFHEPEHKTHRIKMLETLLFFACDNYKSEYDLILDFLTQEHLNDRSFDQNKIQTSFQNIIRMVSDDQTLEDTYIRPFRFLLNESKEDIHESIETLLANVQPEKLLQFKQAFIQCCYPMKLSKLHETLSSKIPPPVLEIINGYAFSLFETYKTQTISAESDLSRLGSVDNSYLDAADKPRQVGVVRIVEQLSTGPNFVL